MAVASPLTGEIVVRSRSCPQKTIGSEGEALRSCKSEAPAEKMEARLTVGVLNQKMVPPSNVTSATVVPETPSTQVFTSSTV